MSCADGAEQFYNLSNNEARYETDLEQARECDKNTQLAWIGHPAFQIIQNRANQTFQQKLDFLLYNVQKQIGLSQLNHSAYKQTTRKFIVDANFYRNNLREMEIKV